MCRVILNMEDSFKSLKSKVHGKRVKAPVQGKKYFKVRMHLLKSLKVLLSTECFSDNEY